MTAERLSSLAQSTTTPPLLVPVGLAIATVSRFQIHGNSPPAFQAFRGPTQLQFPDSPGTAGTTASVNWPFGGLDNIPRYNLSLPRRIPVQPDCPAADSSDSTAEAAATADQDQQQQQQQHSAFSFRMEQNLFSDSPLRSLMEEVINTKPANHDPTNAGSFRKC